jgi:hypothetical protein
MKINKLNFLSLLNGALATDLIIISLALAGYLNANALMIWYQKFGLDAVIADVLVLVLGFIIAFYIYNYFFKTYNMLYFILMLILLQITHDTLFGLFINNYKGNSPILNVFKLYAKEVGYKILIFDALMLISTVLLEKYLSQFNKTYNIILLIVLVYITPYLVFSINK